MENFYKPHVVAVPYPASGHTIPLLDLVKRLASTALTVTYVTTPANASSLYDPLNQAVSAGLDIRLLLLPTPQVEGLPEGCESIDDLPQDSSGLISQLAQKLADPFNAWIDNQFNPEDGEGLTQPPVCIIYDHGIGWAVETAKRHNIASIWFSPNGAFATSMLHSWACSVAQNALQKEDNGDTLVLSINLPRPLRLNRSEMGADFFDPGRLNTRLPFILQRLQSISESSGMLINTFESLEPAYVENLRNLTGKPVWSVGPLLPPKKSAKFSGLRGKMADIGEQELVGWLNLKKRRSVVYVSFGSRMCLSEEQSKALGRALEASGQPFVWAIKVAPKIEPLTSSDMNMSPSDLARIFLPPGFEERTKDRGLVIWGWSPQLVALSHVSVGAFVTHCGWNSTLEGISLGVPLITWPMSGDQPLNSRLVRDLGVGIHFCQDRDGIPHEETVIQAIKSVLDEDKGNEMRNRAETLKEMARKSVGEEGSSTANLQSFVDKMRQLSNRYREAKTQA